jgi:Zn-dependent protease
MSIFDAIGRGDWAWIFGRIIALTIGITVHEFAHAKFADLAGDPTPRAAGRVTLNPLAHYDLLGTTLILLFGMGWGKPVPTNSMLYRFPRRDALRVSLGGIGANLVVACLFGLTLRAGIIPDNFRPLVLEIVLLNLILAFFNILPLYPLDGSHALVWALPRDAARRVGRFYAQYSMGPLLLFLVALRFIPMLGLIIWGPVSLLLMAFAGSGFS